MKLNIFKSTLFLLAAATLGSCSEGKYWEEPSNPGSVYAFAKPAETVSIPAEDAFPSSIDVTISRSNAAGEVSVPVTFKSNSPLITGPESVTFANGSLTATYPISLADGLFAGINYTAELALEQPKDALIHVDANNLAYTLKLSKVLVLEWKSAGTAAVFSSTWAPNEEATDIPMEVATNYPSDELRLCRMIAPYKLLDPDYTPDDANLEFFIDNDGNAAGMASTCQYMGQNDDENGYYFFGGIGKYQGTGFVNEGNEYTMAGVIGTSATLTGDVAAGWYETIAFTWTAPAK